MAVYSSQRAQLVAAAVSAIRQRAGEPQPPRLRLPTAFQSPVLSHQVEGRHLSELQVESGGVGRRLKLVLLPHVISLSARERRWLEAVVAEGGMLVADLPPGTRNEHGTAVAGDWAGEWFGVGFGEGVELGRWSVQAGDAGRETFPALQAGGVTAVARGTAVRLTDGQALASHADGVPALVLKRHGRGSCLLLNLVLARSDPALTAVVGDLLALAGVEPLVEVRDAAGQRVPVDFGCFRRAGTFYAGFVSRGDGGMVAAQAAKPVTVRFPRAAHVYDCRQGRYLGHTDRLGAELVPGLAQLYACLPKPVRWLRLTVPEAGVPRGGTLRVEGGAEPAPEAACRQVWRVRVWRPDGREELAYGRTILVEGGRQALSLPVALDAPTGRWTLGVRDAATGVVAKAEFEVE